MVVLVFYFFLFYFIVHGFVLYHDLFFCFSSVDYKYITGVRFTNMMLPFLDSLAKLQKVTVSFVKSVCLSVRIEQLGCQWTDFYEMRYLSILRIFVKKIHVSLKSDKNNWYFTSIPVYSCKEHYILEATCFRHQVNDKF
jgi:hypothetical protein